MSDDPDAVQPRTTLTRAEWRRQFDRERTVIPDASLYACPFCDLVYCRCAVQEIVS